MTRGGVALVALLLLAACAGTGVGPAIPPPPVLAIDTGTFVVVRAGDTLATESFARSSDSLVAEFTLTGDVTVVTRAALRPDASVERLEILVYPPGPPTGEPLQNSAAAFPPDGGITVEQPIGTVLEDLAAAAPPGVVPYLNPSPAWLEQILRRARMIGASSPDVPVWIPGEPTSGFVRVEFRGDSARVYLGPVEFAARTDAAGRLLGAAVPEQEIEITRR